MTTRAPSDPESAMILGELRGQLREMVHNLNNQAMKNDATAKIIAKLESVPDDISEIKDRLTALERDKDRRDGAMGFGIWLVRSPLVAWLSAGALIAWTWLKGHGQ